MSGPALTPILGVLILRSPDTPPDTLRAVIACWSIDNPWATHVRVYRDGLWFDNEGRGTKHPPLWWAEFPEHAPKPDHIFNPANWEYTVPWAERGDICADEIQEELGVVEYQTLFEGPRVYAADVPVSFDEEGNVDETEIRWFARRDEAQAAYSRRPEEAIE